MPRIPKLSWQMTLKILEFAASLGRDNLVAIQRSVDTWLKSLPVEEHPMEMAPDTRLTTPYGILTTSLEFATLLARGSQRTGQADFSGSISSLPCH